MTASELSISRRCSTESIFSIQEKETDYVRDSSDTEGVEDTDVEYEPVTDPNDDDDILSEDSSGHSDSEFISTEVITVTVKDDGDLELADSEQTESGASDSEIDLNDYWQCAQCRETNNNPIYRYCEKCFKVRKNFFPPRPKRKNKRKTPISEHVPVQYVPRSLSQDSGIESVNSQACLSQDTADHLSQEGTSSTPETDAHNDNRTLKRRADSVDRESKKIRLEPNDDNMCIVCFSEPKSGAFVHGKIAHICCCYKCAVKVWTKVKRCPVCNCKVSNVLKAVVM